MAIFPATNAEELVKTASDAAQIAKAKSSVLLQGAVKQQGKLHQAYKQLQSELTKGRPPSKIDNVNLENVAGDKRAPHSAGLSANIGKPARSDSVQLIGDHHIVANGAPMDRGRVAASLETDLFLTTKCLLGKTQVADAWACCVIG